MEQPPVLTNAQRIDRFRKRGQQVRTVYRWLLVLAPIFLILILADLTRWGIQSQKPVEALAPDLQELFVPLPELPALQLSGALFQSAPSEVVSVATGVVIQQGQWKLRGVLSGANRRAFLENEKGHVAIWVTEGEQVEGIRIKKIEDRFVIVEEGGREYEIRM